MTSNILIVMETFGRSDAKVNPQDERYSEIEWKKGDILFSSMQTLVLPVNCDGLLSDSLGARFRRKYSLMHQKYRSLCEQQLLKPGLLWMFRAKVHVILVFPICSGSYDAQRENLKAGLKKIKQVYKEKGVESMAFPLLCANGADDEEQQQVKNLMENSLKDFGIPVEIYTDEILQSTRLIPLVERLCGSLPEDKKQELRQKICFEQD